MTITLRRDTGKPLTWDQLDGNFTELRDGLVQVGNQIGTINQAVIDAEAAAVEADAARDQAVAAAAIYDDMNLAFVQMGIAVDDIAAQVIQNKTDLALPTGATKVGTPEGTVQDALGERITKAGDDFKQDYASAIGAPVLLKLKERVSALDFMSDAMKADVRSGTPVMDHTARIQEMLSSGEKSMDFLRWKYNVDWGNSGHLAAFTGRDDISILGHGALLKNNHVFTLDNVPAVFAADNCKRLSIKGVNFEGVPIADKSNPTTGIGYRGATFLYLTNGCEDIEVETFLKYLRYGVLAGSYSNAALGYNKNIKQKIRAFECGYPVAHYLSENLDLDIVGLSNHRAAYLAGVKGARGKVLFKDQYIAPIQLLISDALTGVGTSRGSSCMDLYYEDIGSTNYVANSYACAISPSRVDPGTIYEDIKLHGNVKSSDTVAATMSLFALYSAVNATIPGIYPFDWEQSIFLKNIKVSGLLDRTAQTIASHATGGDLYINTLHSGSHYATVTGLDLDGIKILSGSGANPRALYCVVPGLTDRVNVTGCNFTSYTLEFQSNTAAPINFQNCGTITRSSQDSTQTGAVNFVNTNVSHPSQPTTNVTFQNSKLTGGGAIWKNVVRDVTLAGPSVSLANMIPLGALVLGFEGNVTTAITGATGFQFGITGDLARYADLNAVAAGTTFTPANSAVTEVGPRYYRNTTSPLFTAKGSDFTGGVIRVTMQCMFFTPPA